MRRAFSTISILMLSMLASAQTQQEGPHRSILKQEYMIILL